MMILNVSLSFIPSKKLGKRPFGERMRRQRILVNVSRKSQQTHAFKVMIVST